MAIDNLRNVEIVLASGEIVQANDHANSDLFWAIRGIYFPSNIIELTLGGGSNFGVVTEFTYQAYPHLNPVYSGMLVYTPAQIEALVETFNHWFASPDGENPKTAFFVVTCSPPPSFTPTIALLPFFDGDEAEGRRIFKPFFDIGPAADLTKSHPYVEQVNSLDSNLTIECSTKRYHSTSSSQIHESNGHPRSHGANSPHGVRLLFRIHWPYRPRISLLGLYLGALLS